MNEVDLKNKPVEQLLWAAPVSREDDTPLDPATEIGGYNIYYGAITGDYQDSLSVAGNTLYQDLDFNKLPLPLYLVMTAVEMMGVKASTRQKRCLQGRCMPQSHQLV